MKKELKYLMSGILIGTMAMAAPTLADTIWEKIDVARNAIALDVNGTPVDADLFLYNDTTYVPIRVVSELLGKTVTYNPENQSASIVDNFKATFPGEVIGKVNRENITSGELDAYLNMMAKDPQYSALTGDEATAKAKELIVRDHVILQLGEEYGITIDQAFNGTFEGLMYFNQMQRGEQGVADILAAQGMDRNSYKHFYEIEYVTGKLLETADFAVDEATAKTYYDTHLEEFAYDGLRAKHIFFDGRGADGSLLTGDALDAVRQKAEQVLQQAKSGADFDALVDEYNEDPGVANNPDGYVFTHGEMIPDFETAAYQLEAGEISDVVESTVGFHIIKVEEKLPYLPFENAKDDIRNKLANEKLEETIARKIAGAGVTFQ